MKITVIIPTLDAGSSIRELLSRLNLQDTKPSEIIVIDSSSQDDTVNIAQSLGAKTIIIPRHTFNHGTTRNRAASEAGGDTLVFMTQDALPEDNTLLTKLTAPLQVSDIAATFGKQVPRTDATPLEVFAKQFNYPDTGAIKGRDDIKRYGIMTFRLSNVCSAIKKELFMKVGMFPEGVRANEDMLISAQFILNGYRVAYIPGAVVIHSHEYSLLKLFRRYYNIGSSIRTHKWILTYAEPEGEGIKFMKGQIRFVLRQRKYFWIPIIFLESLAKYAGYKFGLIAG